MKKFFVTFADSRLDKALLRMQNQAENLNFFDATFIYSEHNLDKNFLEDFNGKLSPGARGFGFWCWKPQVIIQLLNKMSLNDYLVYAEAGCHLNKNGSHRFYDYFSLADQSETGIVGFRFPNDFPHLCFGQKLLTRCDYQWTKGDVFDYFNVRHDPDITHTPMYNAGAIIIKKKKNTLKFFNQWLNAIREDFNLINDSPSSSLNFEGFIEHRHDQSIYSILFKMNNVQVIDFFELCPRSHEDPKTYKNYDSWQDLNNFPIHARRDKFSFFMKQLDRLRRLPSILKRLIAYAR